MVMRCPIQLVHPFVVLSYLLALHKVILRTELPFYMTIMATIMGHGVLNVAIKFIVVAFFHRWNTLLPTSAGTRLLVRRSTKLVAKKLIRKKSSSRSCQCCHLTEKFWWNIYFSVPKLFNYYIGTTSPSSRQYRALHITECAVQSQSRIQKYRGCFSRFFTVLRYKIFLIKSCGWLFLWSTIWYLGWLGQFRVLKFFVLF